MSYKSDCKAWGEGTYNPAYATYLAQGIGNPTWPAPPPTGASGDDWAHWLDDAGGYREWFPPDASGGNGPPPPPPTGHNN